HLPCKSPDSPGNLLAHAASLKIQPIQWGGDGAYQTLTRFEGDQINDKTVTRAAFASSAWNCSGASLLA
ncbi:hypothetical protein, partial [Sinorhizobium meliloti]|uniref:hypothetical protein n=1 Tax=Rhizobium meliloti TaxID=382 RepID=UPI001AED07A5